MTGKLLSLEDPQNFVLCFCLSSLSYSLFVIFQLDDMFL